MHDAKERAQTNDEWFKELLTVEEVAEQYGVTQRTVRNWCESGVIKHAWKPTPRSAWLIPKKSLQNLKPPKRGRPTGKAIV